MTGYGYDFKRGYGNVTCRNGLKTMYRNVKYPDLFEKCCTGKGTGYGSLRVWKYAKFRDKNGNAVPTIWNF